MIWSSQLYIQLQQLWNLSLRKMRAWTVFEPSEIYQCSALPTELSGSWSHCEFVIYPYKVKNANEYTKDHIFELRWKIWIYDWSLQLYTKLEKSLGLNGIWTHDLSLQHRSSLNFLCITAINNVTEQFGKDGKMQTHVLARWVPKLRNKYN